MTNLPLKARLYTLSIIILGLIIVLFGFINITIFSNSIFYVILFSLLSIISESLAIPVGNSSYLSVTFAIGLTIVLIFDPLIASVIMYIGLVFSVEYKDKKWNHILNTSIYKRLFNGSSHSISALLAGYSYLFGNTIMPYARLSQFNILGIIFAIITYVVLNNFIFMILFSILEKNPFKILILQNIWVLKNFVAISPLGIIMAIAYISYGWFALLLFFGPLLLARYSFKLYLDMRNIYFETITALSNALDAKDHYTNGHSHRVSHYSEVIARRMDLPSNRVDMIKTAALLHDIGKIGVSDYILNKPGHLTEAELSLIQQHSTIGYKILNDIDFLKEVSRIIKYHHEKYDGSGYPDGLEGECIPIEAAILSVADAFDAMTSNRPYRNAMTYTAATNIIINEAGKQFNPIVAKVFKDIMAENREMLINVS